MYTFCTVDCNYEQAFANTDGWVDGKSVPYIQRITNSPGATQHPD